MEKADSGKGQVDISKKNRKRIAVNLDTFADEILSVPLKTIYGFTLVPRSPRSLHFRQTVSFSEFYARALNVYHLALCPKDDISRIIQHRKGLPNGEIIFLSMIPESCSDKKKRALFFQMDESGAPNIGAEIIDRVEPDQVFMFRGSPFHGVELLRRSLL